MKLFMKTVFGDVHESDDIAPEKISTWVKFEDAIIHSKNIECTSVYSFMAEYARICGSESKGSLANYPLSLYIEVLSKFGKVPDDITIESALLSFGTLIREMMSSQVSVRGKKKAEHPPPPVLETVEEPDGEKHSTS